jgi:tRNA (adenine22-N1)-methyltransferase
MILLVFFVLGLVIGICRRGGLSGLVRIRGLWLVLVSFAVERSFLLLRTFLPQFLATWLPVLQSARFLPLFLFILLNIKDWRLCVAGLGIALNFTVIAANGWRMPISWQASSFPEMTQYIQSVQGGGIPEYMVMSGFASVNLWFLGDIVPIKVIPSVPINYVSAGDLLLGIGLMLALQHAMARYSAGRHARGSLAKEAPPKKNKSRKKKAAASAGYTDTADEALMTQYGLLLPHEPAAVPPSTEPKEEPQAPPVQTILPADPHPEPTNGGLSPRLAAVAGLAAGGCVVADVGCDHGKLAVWLATNGAPYVIALDSSAKSLSKAVRLVKEMGLEHTVQLRVSDGLRKLSPGEAEIIAIAGLGGPTICSILEKGYAAASSAMRLVLQPMNAVGEVRRWLYDNGFHIVEEQLAEDDGRIYQVFAAEPGSEGRPPLSLFDLEVGRLLMESRHPLLRKLLMSKIATIEKILAEIAGNGSQRAEARRGELANLKDRCAEALESLEREP